eukprot:gene20329-7346_t
MKLQEHENTQKYEEVQYFAAERTIGFVILIVPASFIGFVIYVIRPVLADERLVDDKSYRNSFGVLFKDYNVKYRH